MCLVNRVEVEHRLRGVLVGTVAGVDDGHRCNLRGVTGGPFEVVPHDDQVDIVAHHHDGVFQRLALRRAGGAGVGEADDSSAQSVDGSLETEAGAGRWLEEERGHDFAFQNLLVGISLESTCGLEQVQNFFF